MRALRIVSGWDKWMNLPAPIRFSGYKIADFTGIQTKLGPTRRNFFNSFTAFTCRAGWVGRLISAGLAKKLKGGCVVKHNRPR
jgi:hypothetical protein